ncbi:short-chain dehydrogenase [Sphaerisporangium siamense]|uniref:NAD(P)-dependent dehydrogenase (Short-subunit alcohol dehydrogenase family) n=1 Tax=Sphaerisporangium siamense TaxID=795645 RepID=A0A7W7D923_9ACTN|nr:SDR family oxidoreductase [Sphaerisporangium siamense]MBB4702492.1 NAD(P)-dependent dehydrogenase (short-subunit alcohol dehydrogenase family) [Sphaerisporangium siamense]GII88189.1 short-chain dehydrogenase [Sphaerisporangium siamense]
MTEKTALIVGGTSGIGLATARRLNALGTQVHVAGRTRARLDAVAASDPKITVHQADGGDAAQVTELLGALGTVDWLILSLSGGEGMGPIADLDLDALRRAFDAKFWVQLTTLKAALPHLAPDGSITLISAISARMAMPGTAGLAALNGAVESLVRPLAVELAPIRVNAVSPGLVDTPWWDAMPEDARRAYFAHAAGLLPARRVATADDVAEAVVLAATNPNVTGTVLESDGGARLVSLA